MLRTTVIGSYPFPGWLEFASRHLDQFGPDDLAETAGRRGHRRGARPDWRPAST